MLDLDAAYQNLISGNISLCNGSFDAVSYLPTPPPTLANTSLC